ncbi:MULTISPECIES: helix-turn-helix domain-containing protein [Bacillus]|uniref:helix-turn-helix domain-containing protein n=1 Tax=Bacillus TaxID=1386 RepID=UPI00101DCC2D|nr:MULTISPECIES: helix-turn-helix domain-containing protein [Bacillus]MDT0160381.1 helix-turn-helix domain-containing protein [Bacillus sp. AG4(2022)]RYI30534.1 helix-turn-helix domain-containing protein [Bacillus infantis]
MTITFGESFKIIRTSSGYKSARQLANKVGVSNATISRIENNSQKPDPETLKLISQHLSNTSYDELMRLAGYVNTSNDTSKNLTPKENELINKARRLSEDQLDLILRIMGEMR